MTIAAHDWVQLGRLLDTALGLPDEERAEWLKVLDREQAALAPVLRELLARPDLIETGGFLQTLPKVLGSRPAVKADASPGDTIGPYRLERVLGSGGMGSVWLAQRVDGLMKRNVALKLPHLSGSTGELAERMARERNILAALEHPSIARLYDAGIAQDGRPYLALEFVEGEAIDAFCRARTSDVRTRVELLLQVARAVAYAHAHLVVHRDLKPSNILVDAQGRVRLLDFGIAKLLDSGVVADGAVTQFGAALTPSYASPEQLRGEPVSTASDVYSLGVVLYELLCQVRPFHAKHAGDAYSLAQAVIADEPTRPSEAAKDRLARRQLRGDLDTIVLKALKKMPTDRYVTVGALAEDLERYLRGDPVLARPDSFWYRTRKLISRNKLASGAVAAVILALSVGLAVSLWQARMLRTEERTSRAVEGFLEDIFRRNSNDQANPGQARQTTVTQLLQIGAREVDASLKDAPESRLRVLGTLAQMHDDLEFYDEAVTLNRKRLDLSRSLYGRDDARNVDVLIDLAHAMQESRSNAERGAVLDEALRILDANGDTSSHTRGHLLGELSSVYQELDLPRALGYATESVRILHALPRTKELGGSLLMQGYLFAALHRYPEAEPALKEALVVSKAMQGERNAGELPRLYATLADVQYFLQKFPEAEHNYTQAYEIPLSQVGEYQLETVLAETRLAQFLVRTSRPLAGLKHLAHAQAAAEKTPGMDDSLSNPTIQVYYGRALLDVGRAQDALPHLEGALEVLKKYRPGSTGVLTSMEKLAVAYARTGNFTAAQPLIEEAKAQRDRTSDRNTNLNGGVEARVALAIAEGHPEEAERALANLYLPPGDDAPGSLTSMQATLLRADVALVRGEADRAMQLATQVSGLVAANPQRAYLKGYEGRALLIAGKAAAASRDLVRAEKLMRSAVTLYAQIYDPASSPLLEDAQVALAGCLLDLNKAGEARELETRAEALDVANAELGPAYHQPLRDLQARLRPINRRI